MYLHDLKPTYKERLLGFIGRLYIEPNHIGVVFRDSQFSNFLKPGWHPSLSGWNQQLVAHIPVKLYTEDLQIEALSSDGWPHNVAAAISFTFNPLKADKSRQAEAADLALNAPNCRLIRDKVMREAQYGARKAIASYDAEHLMWGHIRHRVERDIRHHLQTVLTDLGISIDNTSGVFLKALIPPKIVTRVQNTHYERRKTIELLENHPETAVQAFLLESLTQQNGVVVFNSQNAMHKSLEKLYATAFTNHDHRSTPYSTDEHQTDEYQTMDIVLPTASVRANGKY